MNDSRCPFCNGKCIKQMSYGEGFEYVRNFECSRCHAVFREVYKMTLDKVETLIRPKKKVSKTKV